MISNRWKIILAALPIIGTLAVAQPQPGGLGGFFQAVYGGSRVSIFPDDVADMAGWWDASDASTISLVAGTNRVSEWRDKSGLDRHFTQTDANERPYYDVVQNGLDAMRTAGAEGMFVNAANDIWKFLHNGKASVFIATEIIGPQASGQFGIVLDTARFTGVGFAFEYDNRNANNRYDQLWVISGPLNVAADTDVYDVNTNNVFTPDDPKIFATIIDATNSIAADRVFIYDKSNALISPANTATNIQTGNHAGDLSFGQDFLGLYDIELKMFEIIIYSNTVTETERTALIDYLATKWGI